MNDTSKLLREKSFTFALRIVKLVQALEDGNRQRVLARQLLRSGTSIGANIREATSAHSKADFIAKMQIALKEASETEYWIELLQETGYIAEKAGESLITDCKELLRMITAIIRTAKE